MADTITVDFVAVAYDVAGNVKAFTTGTENTCKAAARTYKRKKNGFRVYPNGNRSTKEGFKMTIQKAKASAYNDVTTAAVYDYMRQYLAEISRMIEPEEDGTGNAYKAKLQEMEKANRAALKVCAAELETVVKRLQYALYGQY